MRILAFLTVSASLLAAGAASAQGYRQGQAADPFGPSGGRATWSQPWQYDSGGDNDSRPHLPSYQQGGGQQTGGPARNLLPYDGFTIMPR